MRLTPRRILASMVTVGAAAGLTFVAAAPAWAATINVSNTVQLAAALANGTDDIIIATGSFTSTTMLVADDDTVDVNGFFVDTTHVELAAGGHLTLKSSVAGGKFYVGNSTAGEAGINTTLGTLTIQSGEIRVGAGAGGAGIGGDAGEDGGIVEISGGTVVADGSSGGAGIGGGASIGAAGGHGGTITITGGTVTARGTLGVDPAAGGGAGIGGGAWNGPGTPSTGGTVSISGTAIVTAAGTSSLTGTGAGIGGGTLGGAGSLAISGSASVTAGAQSSAAGSVGHGSGTVDDGTLSVDGTSRLTVSGTTYINVGATVTGSGTIGGTGILYNGGNIQTEVDLSDGLQVFGKNFPITIDRNFAGAPAPTVVRVYATSMTAAGKTLPNPPPRLGFTFAGWNTAADGSGDPFTASTTLIQVGNETPVSIFAQWTDNGGVVLDLTGPSPVHAGDTNGYTVTDSGSDVTSDMTFTTTDPAAVITGNQIEFRTAGDQQLTGTSISSPAQSVALVVTVLPDTPVALTLTPSATTAPQGGTVTVNATAVDTYGNSLGDVSNQIVLSSDVATDQITGNSVTFPHASPHTITATLGQVSAAFVVQVQPAGVIALTGSDPTSMFLWAAGLLVAGAGLLTLRRVAIRGFAATRPPGTARP